MTATVKIQDGVLRGQVEGGVASFKGIPYAAAPVGSLRWREPQPARPWEGTRDATAFCSDCMQVPGGERIQTAMSEDCLFLNVWKPTDVGPGDGLPVMVWIHGGGYVGGGSSIATYDGTSFADRGIVMVSINYRLGRLGFFAHPALLAAAEGPVGNYGYMDQIKALEWVRDNIAAFGGDPGRITLVGESAGGGSVLHLLTSPAVDDNLFQQAMVMSGGGREAILGRPMSDVALHHMSATTADHKFALEHGVLGHGLTALGQLRLLDPRVVAGDEDLEKLAHIKLLGEPMPGVPIIDGTIVVGEPQDHFLGGDARKVPVIMGSTAVDVPLHFPPSKVHPLRWFGDDEAAAHDAYGVPQGHRLDPQGLIGLVLKIGTDMTMHEPAHFVASTMKRAGQPAWVYRFTYTAESTRPEQMAQVHAGELPFMFGTLASRYGSAVTESDRAMSKAFNSYVANFVKYGDPNGRGPNVEGLPTWPQVVPDEYELMDFSLDDGPTFVPDPRPSVELVARARARQVNAPEHSAAT